MKRFAFSCLHQLSLQTLLQLLLPHSYLLAAFAQTETHKLPTLSVIRCMNRLTLRVLVVMKVEGRKCVVVDSEVVILLQMRCFAIIDVAHVLLVEFRLTLVFQPYGNVDLGWNHH